MEEESNSILTIKYIPRDDTVGFKEPQMLHVVRANGEHGWYHVSLPEDVCLFIEDRSAQPVQENVPLPKGM